MKWLCRVPLGLGTQTYKIKKRIVLLGKVFSRTIGHYLMLEIDARSYISEIRNGLTVGNDNNVLYLPRTVAPNYATLQACLPCCLRFLLHKFIQRLLRCTTTTENVHCIPCRLTGRKMRGKTFAQWFCKSDKKKVHKLSTTHVDSSIPGQKSIVVKLVYRVVRGPRSKTTTEESFLWQL